MPVEHVLLHRQRVPRQVRWRVPHRVTLVPEDSLAAGRRGDDPGDERDGHRGGGFLGAAAAPTAAATATAAVPICRRTSLPSPPVAVADHGPRRRDSNFDLPLDDAVKGPRRGRVDDVDIDGQEA